MLWQVSALMKHVIEQLRKNKPLQKLQKHKLLMDLYMQTPLDAKLDLVQVGAMAYLVRVS